MTVKYWIHTDYLEHDGGTKFYEMVTIHETDGPALLIKRWGKIGNKTGGGQTKIHRGSKTVCADERQAILNEKTRPRADKGKYVEATRPSFGFHMHTISPIDADALSNAAMRHYSADDCGAIMSYFGLVGDASVVDTTAQPKKKEPEPSIDRGDFWASW